MVKFVAIKMHSTYLIVGLKPGLSYIYSKLTNYINNCLSYNTKPKAPELNSFVSLKNGTSRFNKSKFVTK